MFSYFSFEMLFNLATKEELEMHVQEMTFASSFIFCSFYQQHFSILGDILWVAHLIYKLSKLTVQEPFKRNGSFSA